MPAESPAEVEEIRRWSRREIAVLAALLVLALALYLLNFHVMQVGTYQDDAHYIVTARALAAGKGFSLISLVDAPPELNFPPGYPLILVPVVLAVPHSLDALRLPSIVFTLAAIPLWYLYLRKRFAAGWTFLILAAGASNPLIVSHSTMVMSEAAFLFLVSLLAVIGDQIPSGKPLAGIVVAELAASVTALYFVRSIGIAFAVGIILFLLVRRHRLAAGAVGVGFGIPFFAWFYRNASAAGKLQLSSYQGQFANGHGPQQSVVASPLHIIPRVAGNVFSYTTNGIPSVLSLDVLTNHIQHVLGALHLSWIPALIGLIVTVLIVLGFARRLWTQPGLLEFSIALYVGILLIWPWAIPRYLHPLIFLFYLYLVEGIRCAVVYISRVPFVGKRGWRGWRIVVGAVVLLTVLNLARDLEEIRFPVRDRTTDISIGSLWIAANTPSESIVMSSYPLPRSLYTNRRMAEIPTSNTTTADGYLAAVDKARASYVLIAPPLVTPKTTTLDHANSGVEAAIAASPGRFSLVYKDEADNVRVYRVLAVGR